MSRPFRRLNLDWVLPSLAVGGRFPIEAAEHLARKLGIRYVVDVRVEERDDEHVLREHGITLLHLPTADLRAIRRELIDDGVAWVTQRLEEGHKVYIHCEHGVGRSALLALCCMVAMGHPPLEALTLAKKQRWQMSPSSEQLRTFRAWAEDWRARHGLPWQVPELNALADIAYSHLRNPPPAEDTDNED
ncbi:dual specificity protein phosphatase family protein [Pyxidicoccus parkwayensis]|uniref:Dual specificity protein phosphatase family protein n=1 Tax=Pyxidicoccus parkwayensis TaxID=2813578 RepID=A0ABX7NXW8_9BACT|nr:dual specificity protein phosphatase [Pyxidicoccus parkwaysis]QSQ20933.1 dual specificity protein phosphatase family protein [Pyxidicoccus parkwaysis]